MSKSDDEYKRQREIEEEVLAMTDVDLRTEVARLLGATAFRYLPNSALEAYWPENDEGRGEGWEEIRDYPNSIEAAWGLAECLPQITITRLIGRWKVEWFDGVGRGEVEDECAARAITRAFILEFKGR